MAFQPRQTSAAANIGAAGDRLCASLERWLEEEREQLPLWVPVMLGGGIAAWFQLANWLQWLAFCTGALGLATAGLLLPAGGWLRRSVAMAGLLACAGCLLVWGKATVWGEPPLARALFMEVTGEVKGVSPIPAQQMSRLLIQPIDAPALPKRIRINVAAPDMPDGVGQGAIIRFRARLMPPAEAALPGAYDFARRAYFLGIGATGKALKPISVLRPTTSAPPLRARLFSHIVERLDGRGAGIAAALATGDQGGIAEADAEAMRRSGLAHLLSISGLHVTAAIAAVIFLLMRLMALSRRAALDWPLMLIAAGGGALAGVGYTLLTGAEVPTVRSCVAALLVLGGLALGRDAITLRLVAAGACVVLVLWPEAVIGPSFQMSFAAVVALVAFGEHPRVRAFAAARDEQWRRRIVRSIALLLLTGFVVELVLAPIALFHFHRAGMLGAFANLIAIPLTTFIVMPLEAAALLFDLGGMGAPFWWLTGRALDLLLIVAHGVAAHPWALMRAPTMPAMIYGLMITGGLWCLLWRSGWRWMGTVPVIVGCIATAAASPPDILVTSDGHHVAVRTAKGNMAILRAGAGSYVRDMINESAGREGELDALASLPEARCSTDLCAVRLRSDGRDWQLLVTRTNMLVKRESLSGDCAKADIVIADRRLPFWCRPRWLKADRSLLARTGGLAIDLNRMTVRTSRLPGDAHPWIIRSTRPVRHINPSNQLYRRSSPASLP